MSIYVHVHARCFMTLANCDWLITTTGLTGYIRNMCSCLRCSQAEFKVVELPSSYSILLVVDLAFLYLWCVLPTPGLSGSVYSNGSIDDLHGHESPHGPDTTHDVHDVLDASKDGQWVEEVDRQRVEEVDFQRVEEADGQRVEEADCEQVEEENLQIYSIHILQIVYGKVLKTVMELEEFWSGSIADADVILYLLLFPANISSSCCVRLYSTEYTTIHTSQLVLNANTPLRSIWCASTAATHPSMAAVHRCHSDLGPLL